MPCSAVDYTREEAIDVFGLEAKRGPQTPTDRVSAIVVQKDDRKQGRNHHNDFGLFLRNGTSNL